MQKYEMNLYDYWRIIRKRKMVILGSIFIVVLCTYIYTRGQVPTYETRSRIRFQQHRTVSSLLITELILYQPGDIMSSQAQVASSSSVIEKAARLLGKVTDSTSVTELQQIVSDIQSKVKAERLENTDIIEITATSHLPEEAMAIANAVADAYREHNRDENQEQMSQVINFVSPQLEVVEKRLSISTDKIKEFEENNAPLISEYTRLEKELPDLKLKLSGLLKKYTEKHPDVIVLQEEINRMDSAIRNLPALNLEREKLTRAVAEDKELYGTLKKKLDEALLAKSEKVGDVSVTDYASLPTIPKGPSKVMNIIVAITIGTMFGFVGAFISEQLDTSIGTIEDVEAFLELPVLGVIPHIAITSEKKMFLLFKKKKGESERILELQERLVTQIDPKSTIAEAYRTLRTNIQFIALEGHKKVILFTSAGPLEGKSITSANYAVTMSQMGHNTLLIDADLRRPVIHRIFGVEREPGLSNILLGTVKPDEAIKSLADILSGTLLKKEKVSDIRGLDKLNIITAGALPPNPAEMLSSKRMEDLLQQFKERFDTVIFDCTPVLPVTDAALLGSKVDGVILVYQVGKTARGALRRAKMQLDSVKANILGVTLNDIGRREIEEGSSYYYYYRYYSEK